MSSSLNKIEILEKRVNKVLEMIGSLQAENAGLREENKDLTRDLSEVRKKFEAREKETEAMRSKYEEALASQDKVKDKIETMLENLDHIEKKIASGDAGARARPGEEVPEEPAEEHAETIEEEVDPASLDASLEEEGSARENGEEKEAADGNEEDTGERSLF
jgi:FtsZ-binding cell division protein ZapB